MASKTVCKSLVFLALAMAARGELLHETGFEQNGMPAGWFTSQTSQGVSLITELHKPHSGNRHLLLTDAKADSVFSVAEATLKVNLEGRRNVTLQFWAKSTGNEPDAAHFGIFSDQLRNFDGVSLSLDGGKFWTELQSLAYLEPGWQKFSVNLDSYAVPFGGYGKDCRIRFSAYDNSPAPLDGIVIDDVKLSGDSYQQVFLDLPPTILEGNAPRKALVFLSHPPETALTVTLRSEPPGAFNLPASITFPPRRQSVEIDLSVPDDNRLTGKREAQLFAESPELAPASASIVIKDNELPELKVQLPPRIREGVGQGSGQIILDVKAGVPLRFRISTEPAGVLSLPNFVTIAPGETSADFRIRTLDNSRINGDVPVKVTCDLAGSVSATARMIVMDGNSKGLELQLPDHVDEGSSATGYVHAGAILDHPLAIQLTTAAGGTLTLPASVILPKGKNKVAFTLRATNNKTPGPTTSATIRAAAEGFGSDEQSIEIHDDDPASYQFSKVPDFATKDGISLSFLILDSAGTTLTNTSVPVSLWFIMPDGTTAATYVKKVTPASGKWTGRIPVPAGSPLPVGLRLVDGNGTTVDSTRMDPLRTLAQKASDLVWDSKRNRIYACIPANPTGPNSNKVLVIDPATGLITSSITVSPDPKQLAITSDQQYLYVSLDGNGTISQYDLDTLALVRNFAIGSSPSQGTHYAGDIATVAGSPDLLLVSKHYQNGHVGASLYDQGVALKNSTNRYPDNSRIEPSSDPSIFFSYNNDDSGFDFQKLRIDKDGVTQMEIGQIFEGYSLDFQSSGDLVVSDDGTVGNGAELRKTGSLVSAGTACPETETGRIYQLAKSDWSDSAASKLVAYDTVSLSAIRQATFPKPFDETRRLIRWGANGLAFLATDSIAILSSPRFVPSGDPTDLAVRITASKNPAKTGEPFSYTVTVTNQGPHPADDANVGISLSNFQTWIGMTASLGTATKTGSNITWTVGTLAPAATATLVIEVNPTTSGSVTCAAGAGSMAIESSPEDNRAFRLVNVGFTSSPNSINPVRLGANLVITDPTRGILWASIPSTATTGLAKSIVSIDPNTGLTSDPIPLVADPACLAISPDGTYLYVGFSDASEIRRIRLADRVTDLVIPVVSHPSYGTSYAEDIVVLEGDGTSILISANNTPDKIGVYDGAVRRPDTTHAYYGPTRIEATADPAVFVGADDDSPGSATMLTVTEQGVTETKVVGNIVKAAYGEISGDGNLVFSSGGTLLDSATLTLKANLGTDNGKPLLSAARKRAYLFVGKQIRSYSTENYLSTGVFNLPNSFNDDDFNYYSEYKGFTSWGSDGFAVLDDSGTLFVVRWSPPATISKALAAISPDSPVADTDGDGTADVFENLFGTSIDIPDAPPPIRISMSGSAEAPQMVVRLKRRADVSSQSYRVVTSTDLVTWVVAMDCREAVIGSSVSEGVEMADVEIRLRKPGDGSGFVRLEWIGAK